MKRTLTQKLGLLGVLSFLSYAAAVVLAPLAYPGYDWMAQSCWMFAPPTNTGRGISPAVKMFLCSPLTKWLA